MLAGHALLSSMAQCQSMLDARQILMVRNEPQCAARARQSRRATGCANIYRPRVHHLCTCHSIFGSSRSPHPQHFPHPCGQRKRESSHEHNWQRGRWPRSVPSLQASITPYRGPRTGCVKGGLLTLARRAPPARPCPDLDTHSTHIRVKHRTRARRGPPSAGTRPGTTALRGAMPHTSTVSRLVRSPSVPPARTHTKPVGLAGSPSSATRDGDGEEKYACGEQSPQLR